MPALMVMIMSLNNSNDVMTIYNEQLYTATPDPLYSRPWSSYRVSNILSVQLAEYGQKIISSVIDSILDGTRCCKT